MANRHWLDPLARRLLIATGQLAPAARPVRGGSSDARSEAPDDLVERELLALKLRQDPSLRLRSAEEVRHAAALGWRLDVNRATAADWLRLPGCQSDQVDLLLRLQASGVQLSGPEDLQEVLQLERQQLLLWKPLLDFRWYGTPAPAPSPSQAVDVNRADGEALAALPAMDPARCQRLLQERARSPFRDLADLQERLQLPPDVVERWIGRVSFPPPSAGPVLPPGVRRPGR